jgi:hypothetical protein
MPIAPGDASPRRNILFVGALLFEMPGPDAARLISRYQLVKQQHPQYGISRARHVASKHAALKEDVS